MANKHKIVQLSASVFLKVKLEATDINPLLREKEKVKTKLCCLVFCVRAYIYFSPCRSYEGRQSVRQVLVSLILISSLVALPM